MLLDYDPDDLDVRISELLVATSDAADPSLPPGVQEVLGMLRERLGMDVVFVSEFTNGRRAFRAVDQAPGQQLLTVGASDPLEESWCQRVVDGRLPELIPDARPLVAAGRAPATSFPIGTHISTPVQLKDGSVYGTLCCFSLSPRPGTGIGDLKRLKFTAELLADKLAPPLDLA